LEEHSLRAFENRLLRDYLNPKERKWLEDEAKYIHT
jgi:hypothetical protein